MNRRWSVAVRPRPLSAKTMRRIQEGVQRFFGAPLGAVVDLFADLPRGIPQNAGLTLSLCSPPLSRLEPHRVGTRDGIRHAVLSVPGVTSVEITANETAETDAAGIPPHSILVVVTGGDDAHVARALLESIPAGIGVRWTRPPVGGASVETPDTCYSCGVSGHVTEDAHLIRTTLDCANMGQAAIKPAGPQVYAALSRLDASARAAQSLADALLSTTKRDVDGPCWCRPGLKARGNEGDHERQCQTKRPALREAGRIP